MDSRFNESRGQSFSATHLNFYEFPSADPAEIEVWCYTDRLSYKPGDTVNFHSSTRASEYVIEVARDGRKLETVYDSGPLEGGYHPTPEDCYAQGCNWPVAHQWQIPADIASGGYLVLSRTRNTEGETVEHEHFFIVQAAQPGVNADILLVCATSTWIAYNGWGGCNHYEGNSKGPDENMMSPVLHTHRPWGKGQVWLPEGAPRIPLEKPPRPGAVPRYPNMEWAYANGFCKYYAAAGWASYERLFVRWAEDNGYQLDYACQHDLHFQPDLLKPYQCVVFVGHDEYWSAPMRDVVDDYVDGGGHVARFGANFCWQVRLEAQGLQQVCYKYPAPYHGIRDPLEDSQPELLTGLWEHPKINRPGAQTFGLTGARGVYAGLGGLAPRNSGGFTVFRPQHWVFEDTDLYYGDTFGTDVALHAYEVDGISYTFRDGLPYPTGEDGAPDNLEILAMGFATLVEEDHGHKGTHLYAGDGDVQLMALTLYGNNDEDSMGKSSRGAGMIASFSRGKGQVVNAGTCEWVNGLRLGNPFAEQITHNVLRRFTA